MNANSCAQRALHVVPASQLTPRPLSWLWPGRLALGKLALLDGDPQLGKSLLTLDLCARLSTGRPFPDGTPSPGPATSLIFNAEDGAADTILPRLRALGADLDRVLVAPRGDPSAALALPGDLGPLDDLVAQTGARFVVLDPVVAFLQASVLSASDQSVRRALAPLADLAERRKCAVEMVRHLNKKGGGKALYRGGGSIGFTAACRSCWLAAAEPGGTGRCVLAQVKNNLGPPQPALTYEIGTGADGLPTLTWLGAAAWTPDQLLAHRSPAAGPTLNQAERARAFLERALQAGPRTARELWEQAQKEGHSERTLYRAKIELQARSVRVMLEGRRHTYWLRPGQQLPPEIPPEAVPPDLEDYLAPLRALYPPSTPLDDL
jgi:putative DNA primase/helicase